MRGQVILRFLLEGGHILDILMTDGVAKQTLRNYSQEIVKENPLAVFQGIDLTSRDWAVDIRRIQAMFTISE